MRYPSESGPHVAGPTRWKRCSACGHVKPAPEFFASRFTRDGITDRCCRCTYDAAARDRAERERRRPGKRPAAARGSVQGERQGAAKGWRPADPDRPPAAKNHVEDGGDATRSL